MAYPHLFEPIKLGPLEVKNRLAMTPHYGALTPRGIRYIEQRARWLRADGRLGLVHGVLQYSPAPGRFVTSAENEFDAVLPNPATPEGVAFFDDRVIPRFREVAAMLHSYGVVALSQMNYLGASPTMSGLIHPVGPSPIRNEEAHSMPFVLDEEHIGSSSRSAAPRAELGRPASTRSRCTPPTAN